jgi:hypothetical protein
MPLNGVSLPQDRYRVVLVGSGGSPIRDTVGNTLDGETTGSLPSGNGSPGGDFVSEFLIVPATGSASACPSWRFYR